MSCPFHYLQFAVVNVKVIGAMPLAIMLVRRNFILKRELFFPLPSKGGRFFFFFVRCGNGFDGGQILNYSDVLEL